jgi:DNA mismatch repair protein MutS2
VRAGFLLDASSAQMLGFAWLREAVAPVSEYGERLFAQIEPFGPGEEMPARERALRIAGVAAAADERCLDAVRNVLRNAPDVFSAIARASMDDVLTDVHFFELQRLNDALVRVDELLDGVPGVPEAQNDGSRAVAEALEAGRAGKFGFYLADAFDDALTVARANLFRTQAEYDAALGRAVQRVAVQLGRDDLGSGEFIVMRSDAPEALPLGVRVIREAPTYFLCELEYDDVTLSALQRRDAAADAVAATEEAVRVRLSATVRVHVSDLDRATRTLGEIDVVVAAARFTRLHACHCAEIVSHGELSFEKGRYLPLAVEIEADGRKFTPIDVELHDVAVLTGPNMGGKSVCLRTCGFVATCAAFGLPVPARGARSGLFDEIAWLGIGADDDEMGGLLSSFAREVVRLRDLLARGEKQLFVLIDEFGRTTTPHEGKALLIALLERLRNRDACGMVATHLGGVAREAGLRHFAVRGLRGIPQQPATSNLHEALSALAASMDYTIAEVGEGEEVRRADAIALAALLGLDAGLIDAAYRALK